jgi:exosortase
MIEPQNKTMLEPSVHNSPHQDLVSQLSWGAFAVLGGLMVLMYWDVVPAMANTWWTDEAYSHGLLIPPLALYVAWLNRDQILAVPAAADSRGILLTGIGCAMHLLGRLGAEFFLTRVSMVVILAGIILTYWGIGRLGQLSFALVLLATMVPIPQIIYNKLAAPLQLFASSVASSTLEIMGIPIFRDGNVMHLSEISLGVAEACSGLRSISSLSVLALVIGYLVCTTVGVRTLLFFMSFPVAIAVNVLRIVITALFAREDPALAEGFFHSFSGWVVFLVGFTFMYAIAVLFARFEPNSSEHAGGNS